LIIHPRRWHFNFNAFLYIYIRSLLENSTTFNTDISEAPAELGHSVWLNVNVSSYVYTLLPRYLYFFLVFKSINNNNNMVIEILNLSLLLYIVFKVKIPYENSLLLLLLLLLKFSWFIPSKLRYRITIFDFSRS